MPSELHFGVVHEVIRELVSKLKIDLIVMSMRGQKESPRTCALFLSFPQRTRKFRTGWRREMDSNPRSRWLSAKTADFYDFPFSNHGNRKK